MEALLETKEMNSFHLAIKSIERNKINCIINKKNKIFIKNRIKDQWLYRSKIIPPTFERFSKENYEFY